MTDSLNSESLADELELYRIFGQKTAMFGGLNANEWRTFLKRNTVEESGPGFNIGDTTSG